MPFWCSVSTPNLRSCDRYHFLIRTTASTAIVCLTPAFHLFLTILHQGVGSAMAGFQLLGQLQHHSTRRAGSHRTPRHEATAKCRGIEINFRLRINVHVPSSHTASKSRESLKKSACKIGNTQRSSQKRTKGRRCNPRTTIKVNERFRLYTYMSQSHQCFCSSESFCRTF